jgi:hypothetical protein
MYLMLSELLIVVEADVLNVYYLPRMSKIKPENNNTFSNHVYLIKISSKLNVHESLHLNNISICVYIQQDATLHSLLYLEIDLHFSGGTSTHHQEHKHLYLRHMIFVTPLLLSATIFKELELVCSNSSTIAADSSNGVTNNRCCRYRCMRSWWWVDIPPESYRAVSTYK